MATTKVEKIGELAQAIYDEARAGAVQDVLIELEDVLAKYATEDQKPGLTAAIEMIRSNF